MKKTSNKKTGSRKSKAKKYPAHYLALALVMVLMVEGILVGSAQAADWQQGSHLLDMSGGVSETVMDTGSLFQPVGEVIRDVNLFYQDSATQMTNLLDLSDSFSDFSNVFDGVSMFYEQASTQAMALLNFANPPSWPAMVSGASVQK